MACWGVHRPHGAARSGGADSCVRGFLRVTMLCDLLSQLDAALNITLTTLILVMLTLSAFAFGRDATTFVILPIETMLSYLRRIININQDPGGQYGPDDAYSEGQST